ncbi:MAG: hypothetical protein WDA08_12270, partial [Weeksellaceae bacterium]
GRAIDPVKDKDGNITGWTFTGVDANLVGGYFAGNGDFGSLVSQLEGYGSDFGSGPLSSFWSTFNSNGVLHSFQRNGWLHWSFVSNEGFKGLGNLNQTNFFAKKLYETSASKDSESSNNFWMNDDEYLTFEEAFYNWRFGKGQPANVRLSNLDLSKVRVRDFKKSNNTYQNNPIMVVNFYTTHYTNLEQARVYGKILLVYIGDNTVMALPDTYDFNPEYNFSTPDAVLREVGTITGHLFNGMGTPFGIQFLGTAKIKD